MKVIINSHLNPIKVHQSPLWFHHCQPVTKHSVQTDQFGPLVLGQCTEILALLQGGDRISRSHDSAKYGGYIAGWWFQPTPLKNDGVKVSWDDDIPNMMGESHKNKNVPVTTNQIVMGVPPKLDGYPLVI